MYLYIIEGHNIISLLNKVLNDCILIYNHLKEYGLMVKQKASTFFILVRI